MSSEATLADRQSVEQWLACEEMTRLSRRRALGELEGNAVSKKFLFREQGAMGYRK